jgi:hypothetical protein
VLDGDRNRVEALRAEDAVLDRGAGNRVSVVGPRRKSEATRDTRS